MLWTHGFFFYYFTDFALFDHGLLPTNTPKGTDLLTLNTDSCTFLAFSPRSSHQSPHMTVTLALT